MNLWPVEYFFLHKKVPVVLYRSDFLQNPYFSGILNVKETGQKKREKPTTRPHDGLLKENKS